jgi:hypothetical protein
MMSQYPQFGMSQYRPTFVGSINATEEEEEESPKTLSFNWKSDRQIDERLENQYAKIQLEKVKPYREESIGQMPKGFPAKKGKGSWLFGE